MLLPNYNQHCPGPLLVPRVRSIKAETRFLKQSLALCCPGSAEDRACNEWGDSEGNLLEESPILAGFEGITSQCWKKGQWKCSVSLKGLYESQSPGQDGTQSLLQPRRGKDNCNNFAV